MARLLPPSPPSSSAATTKAMKGNRGKGTKPELLLRKALWHEGARGYRVNWKGAPGRPDICFPGRRLAIFVHGCFWHRCTRCHLGLPKSNTEFWKRKFELNVARDQKKERLLIEAGWKVITVWQCELKAEPAKTVDTILRCLQSIDKSLQKKG
jgi:DNA mismatch endonuclease (patch repair protein)